MKSKKFFLPIIILAAAVLAIAVLSVVISIAEKPTITEHEFPFSITYEYNGETITFSDVLKAWYFKNGGYTDSKTRFYNFKIGDMEENVNSITIKDDKDGRIEIETKLYADYLMGDPEYDYFDDTDFAPKIWYYDAEGNAYSEEDVLSEQGVKLISYEYPEPIENSFVFSHISILNCDVVLPSLVICFAALLVTLIFVKKEKDSVLQPMDIVSIVLNFLVCIVILPIITFCAIFFDVTGDNESIFNQIMYFVPALTVLGVTVSAALRRKKYTMPAFIVEFTGPAVFAVMMIIAAVSELLLSF